MYPWLYSFPIFAVVMSPLLPPLLAEMQLFSEMELRVSPADMVSLYTELVYISSWADLVLPVEVLPAN